MRSRFLLAAVAALVLPSLAATAVDERWVPTEQSGLRGTARRRLMDEDGAGKGWKDRVKEKGETVFQEKKRAAIRAACYKDW
jgi:hypothetical protein